MTDVRLLLRLPEGAARAGVGLTTLRELIRSGQIAVVRIGRRGVRIPAAALEAWIEREAETAQSRGNAGRRRGQRHAE
jgi:excisionase family DNA binding protein